MRVWFSNDTRLSVKFSHLTASASRFYPRGVGSGQGQVVGCWKVVASSSGSPVGFGALWQKVSLSPNVADTSHFTCCCFEDSANLLRIQHSNSLWFVSLLFFLYIEFISSLDALHSVHNSLYLHTLPRSKLSQ